MAVNGTLMRGLELNPNMINAGATFVRETTTAAAYRLWSINDRHPAMIRVASGGATVAVEVWEVPPEGLARSLPAGASARSTCRTVKRSWACLGSPCSARDSARSPTTAAGVRTWPRDTQPGRLGHEGHRLVVALIVAVTLLGEYSQH